METMEVASFWQGQELRLSHSIAKMRQSYMAPASATVAERKARFARDSAWMVYLRDTLREVPVGSAPHVYMAAVDGASTEFGLAVPDLVGLDDMAQGVVQGVLQRDPRVREHWQMHEILARLIGEDLTLLLIALYHAECVDAVKQQRQRMAEPAHDWASHGRSQPVAVQGGDR